ncbi:proline-rich transmembrane protein 3 [Sphaerodactylus townsendi]|uniref:proline-rich transmembrane protein 3 n=1 Tax=Sphaerodactylus townsendi TaxID=933632 RepID=UPI0020266F76|nr:proline-rich transmembrane protein 3 [Sphaerodactylus townsendi]XP_048346760.1 proline-rich transmembrane protein 3 [Sphaerodactylus townsendi]XP_048346761.1 proline-rich transmembrane protein 3 [Sphaerodactylus townsendi]XP_048346762.1 proline-rich transmembrane protein 3 [Sphaerodactylus townsendi]
MAAMGLSFTWSLLLPSLLRAFSLPTPDSPAWNSSLSSAPELPSLNGSSQESLLPAVPHLDPDAHEVSSGDGVPRAEDWRSASPTVITGPPVLTWPVDFPAVTTSGPGSPTNASGGSLDFQGGDSPLPTTGPSHVQKEPEDVGHVTVGPGPQLEKNESSFSLPDVERATTANLGMVPFPESSREGVLDFAPSQEGTTRSHVHVVFKDASTATTVSPRPTVSTIPLVTLPSGVSRIKWMATLGTDPRGDDSTGKELLDRNQSTVKYLASYRSTQVYGGPQDSEGLSTSPFNATLAAEYTQSPLEPQKGTVGLGAASQTPQLTTMTVPLDKKGQKAAVLPDGSHHSSLEDLFLSPSPPLPTEGTRATQGPVVHERITHWSLIVDTTQQAGTQRTTGTERTRSLGSSTNPAFSSFTTPGTGEVVDIDPQRVRGAVIPRIPVGSTTPGQGIFMVVKGQGTRHPDPAGTQSPGQSSAVLATLSSRLPATPRRGLIRVTTQRALQHPQLARPEPSQPALLPASSPPCPRPGSACSQFMLNQTLLQWKDLERTLSFAWALHVYGLAVLFLLLSLLSLVCLVGSLATHAPHLPYVVAASALLLAFGVLRATFFLVDPYGSRGWLPSRAVRVLYMTPFPLLLSTFAVLLLRLLCQAHLQVLPPRLQSLLSLAVLGSVQSLLLLGADLLTPPMHPVVAVGLHTLSCTAGFCLLPITMLVYWQLRHSAASEGTPEPGVWSGAWLLLGSSGLALPCCGLQLYGVLWLSGVLGRPDVFSWGWWFVQFWFRIGELVLSFTLAFLAGQALCQRYGSSEHSCWAKLARYFCTYRKAEVPEYPNNCYNWSGGVLEKVPNNDISKSLIRNPPTSGRLWALKDNNELRAAASQHSSPSPVHPVYSPKCPNAAATTMGRSYTSICFERDSVLSLAELEFRPPSPINLSRSIDEALFREHLVRDSIFLRSSLHFPSRLARQDSCSSLRGECSTLSHTAQPLLGRPRRSSDPDCLYSLARASSMGELTTQSRGLASEPPTDTSFDSFSRTSFSRASLKISWNPWRHGLSSPESLPAEELPCQAQLLPDDLPPAPSSSAPNSDGEARRSFLALSKQVDSRSLSSDTIEL